MKTSGLCHQPHARRTQEIAAEAKAFFSTLAGS
jgi:hypothetical protein